MLAAMPAGLATLALTALGLVNAIPFPDWLSDEIFSIGPVTLRWYGLAYVVGWFLALRLAIATVRRPELFAVPGTPRAAEKVPSAQRLEDLWFWGLIGVLLGGRLGSVALYEPQKYLADPLAILRVWEGGMAFHGGFLGVVLVVVLYARRHGYSILRLLDIAALGTPIGLFLGRLANFANQELWGHVTDVPWGIVFDTGGPLPRHPSQLYEAALEGVALFFILLLLARRFRILARPGIAGGVFVAGYGIFRIIVEQFRVPDADLILGLSRGTAYSLPMVVVGGAFAVWAARRAPTEPVLEGAEAAEELETA